MEENTDKVDEDEVFALEVFVTNGFGEIEEYGESSHFRIEDKAEK